MSKIDVSYSVAEEWANSLSHAVGVILSIIGLVCLIVLTSKEDSAMSVTAVSIYGASLIVLFLASTLYHSVQKPSLKRKFKIFDHCAIYGLIAGTYTPFMLVSLKGAWGYSITAVIWSLALIGIVFKLFFTEKFPKLSLFTYLLMGWLIIIASAELIAKVPTGGLVLLAIGGVVYSLGTIFYQMEKIPFNHAIWHFFVLAGALCHFFSVFYYVIPQHLAVV